MPRMVLQVEALRGAAALLLRPIPQNKGSAQLRSPRRAKALLLQRLLQRHLSLLHSTTERLADVVAKAIPLLDSTDPLRLLGSAPLRTQRCAKGAHGMPMRAQRSARVLPLPLLRCPI